MNMKESRFNAETGLTNDELADIMAMFPKVDFGYDVDEQLVIYTGRYLRSEEDKSK